MMSLTAEEAFAAYEAVRPRLPSPVPPAPPTRHVATLAEIADEFDVFLLDAFGVLNIGETAIPGTAERIADLRAAGKSVSVVSNAASLPASDLLQKYRRLGYQFDLPDIVTSRTALAAAMNGHIIKRWGVMAPARSVFDDLGPLDMAALGDEARVFDEVDGFLLMGSAQWTPTRQALLEDALKTRPRPVLVANPDIVAPRESGFSQEPGFFAHQLADRVGVVPTFYGKPFPDVFDLALSRLGPIDKSRVVMIGDSLHTDILGAQTSGIRSALIANYGFFAGMNVENAIQRAGIIPDFVVDRP
ncbi:TIGR01459 family HAD-type hydrolase [Antarctobacter sp.]|uniref:TIGR01459 family HAD-type hydrolase n=1 Tax=Antarctobacter sp. TaxID=1872577 RepID=UPI002B264DB0|nr:TIGR01459 family HAD-type hydrolase [Antarctobacter sp.]